MTHSVTVSSDGMGTLVSLVKVDLLLQSAIDGTAAGDIWDNGLEGAVVVLNGSEAGNNNMFTHFHQLMDGLTLKHHYSPSNSWFWW